MSCIIVLSILGCFSTCQCNYGGYTFDPLSSSTPHDSVVYHLHWKARVDFPREIIVATATYSVKRSPWSTKLILDASDDLKVNSVRISPLAFLTSFERSTSDPKSLGSPLIINFAPKTPERFEVIIDYETSPGSKSLIWLQRDQTLGRKLPFVFSFNKPINARALLPCQDTPQVRMTYSAEVEVPSRMVALLSASIYHIEYNDTIKTKTFYSRQEIPTQSYLFAFAVGELDYRQIGVNSYVWAEEGNLDLAAKGLANVDSILAAAASVLGPYRYSHYDVLIIPPAFAYDGVEHPCLTMIPAAILIPDMYFTSVIIHQIAHSWFGNLVAPKTFSDVWISEGLSSFMEGKIFGVLYGEDYRKFTNKLAINLSKSDSEPISVHGDSLRSRVTWNTGYSELKTGYFCSSSGYMGRAFLCYLEELVGGPLEMNKFLAAYIEHFKFTSIDTTDFKDYYNYYFNDRPSTIRNVDWDDWLLKRSLPDYVNYSSIAYDDVNKLAKSWMNSTLYAKNILFDKLRSLDYFQAVIFLSQLELATLSHDQLLELSRAFQFSEKTRVGILMSWFKIGLRNHYTPILKPLENFLMKTATWSEKAILQRELKVWKKDEIISMDENSDCMLDCLAYSATNTRIARHDYDFRQPVKEETRPR